MVALPDYPVMYCSRAEWSMLPKEAYQKEAHMTVPLLNCTKSCQTNSSDIQTATKNNQLYINYSVGMEEG
jgi:hypothetical protein